MGVGVLLLLVALVPFASSRDLRTATKVNRRTAPDPLLVQLFNDPTVTSLTKQNLDDSDDASASGSGMWSMSGDEPKTLDSDKTTETGTKQNAPSSSDTATAVELATDQSTADVGSGSGAQPSAQTAAPTKTEDETVETKDDSMTHEDDNAKKSSFIPAETQAVTDQVEEGGNDVRDSTAAPKAKAFDEKNMYDATIVKKDDVPKPNDVTATSKSVIVPSPDEQGGLAPLTTDMNAPQNDQPQQLDQAQQVQQPPQMQQPQQDMAAQMAMQSQQDMPQPAMQQPQPDMSQAAMQPQQDMVQAPQQPEAAQQPFASDPSTTGQAQAYTGQFQDPTQQQAGAAAYQGQIPPATDQAMMEGQQQANAPVAPVNPYADPSMIGQQVDPQTGMPIAGMQAVPVFQGLKAKKVILKEDECDDMYDSCPEMAKNKYCENYVDLMKVQCKKSCGFCKVKDESPASGSADESSGSPLGDSSASGSAMWNDEDNELPIWRKSGIPSVGDKVVGESASGSATASDSWSTSASGANMIKGESDTPSDSAPVVPPPKKEDASPEIVESGSGQASEDIGSASGANLAEDLATGTVSKTEQDKPAATAPKAKYSEIPVPRPVIVQQQPAAEIFPRIDLKVIAKAVNAYKSTALRMLGEAIRDAAQDAENKATKRTNIPMPPANDLLQKMGFPMEQPRSEMPPLPQPNPYAQYYQQPAYNNYQQNYYTVQQNSIAKSEVQKPKPKAKEPKKEDKPKKEDDEDDKKSDVKDPFQYVRHMKAGQSMQPIESRPGASLAPRSHSNPIILFKNSQISNEAAKKNAIPKVPKKPQAMPAARFGIPQPQFNPNIPQTKSDVPSELLNQNDNMVAPAVEVAPQYEQQMPSSDNQLDSTMDDAAMMRSQTTTAYQAPGDEDVNLRELRSFFPDKENKKKRKRNVKTN